MRRTAVSIHRASAVLNAVDAAIRTTIEAARLRLTSAAAARIDATIAPATAHGSQVFYFGIFMGMRSESSRIQRALVSLALVVFVVGMINALAV